MNNAVLKVLLGLIGIVSAASAMAQSGPPAADIVLQGVLHPADKGSYRELPFTVPAGVEKIDVDIRWEGREQGTILVTGLYDPQRLRGWGGGIKPHFVVADAFASPSFLPGPIPSGIWRLTLAVASIRPGIVSPFSARIRFSRGAAAQVVTDTPVRPGAGWYRGDLHTHTGQSDAACRSRSGAAIPCPLFLTLQAAVAHGLDFVVITDHNASSQVAELPELAPYFDSLLIIPGREMTTAVGHFNLLGIVAPIDFRMGPGYAGSINDIFASARPTGALISINHPEIPTGEDCLGCGWSAPGTDFAMVDTIEVANGGIAADKHGFDDGPGSGTAYWETLLDRGYRLIGVGGSDNHDAVDGKAGTSPVGAQSPVGTPATVVFSTNLSQPAILAGIRSGRVFIDLEGASPARLLDMWASTKAGVTAVMGETLHRFGGKMVVDAHVRVAGASGCTASLIVGGSRLPAASRTITKADEILDLHVPLAAATRWFRVDVRDSAGRRVMIGNPIFVR
jgi:hypothetical protein